MAKNMTHKYTKTEVWPVATEVDSGVAVLSSTSQPGVTLTGSGGLTKSFTQGPYTVTGIPAGGVGLKPLFATVAVDGGFKFPVTGAAAGTARNTLVYITSGGTLTLTATGNTKFGKFDRLIGEKSATESSVLIGAF